VAPASVERRCPDADGFLCVAPKSQADPLLFQCCHAQAGCPADPAQSARGSAARPR